MKALIQCLLVLLTIVSQPASKLIASNPAPSPVRCACAACATRCCCVGAPDDRQPGPPPAAPLSPSAQDHAPLPLPAAVFVLLPDLAVLPDPAARQDSSAFPVSSPPLFRRICVNLN